jgi:hypothetical protein
MEKLTTAYLVRVLILMFYQIVACFRLVHLTSWRLLQALMDLTSMVSPETSQRLD